MKEPIKSLEFVISFEKSNELRTEVTGLNLPTGCLITTRVKYSSACAVTSEFVLGIMYNDKLKDFVKIENIVDDIVSEGTATLKDAYHKMRDLWDDNKEPKEWLQKDQKAKEK